MKRNPLSKRVPRELAKNAGKYLGMIIILVCTISIGSSFQSALNGAVEYLDEIKDRNMQEDGFLETAYEIQPDNLAYIEDKDIEVYENAYVIENNFMGDVKVKIFNERKDIDIPTLFEGALPKAKDEIALDHVFARSRDVKIGDTVHMQDRDLKVCGTVSLPDYTALFSSNTDVMMNPSYCCVAIVTEETFAQFDEYAVVHRYSYRYHDRDLKKSEKNEIVEDIAKHLVMSGEQLQDFLPAEQNQSISYLEMDIGSDGPMMVVFVYILVAMIAFVFAILTNSTIERESVIIGTLLASGYKKTEIMWHYLQPTLIVGVVGSVIGNVIGYTVMIQPFLDLYYTSYSIGPLEITFSVPTFITTTILPVFLMIVINYAMLAKKLSLKPLKFLRRDLKKGKQKKAVKLPDFKFLNRFRLRVIIQNTGSYVILFLGIFFASFLLMFGIGVNPLMSHYTESIDESLPFDYQYVLKAPCEVDGGERVRMYEMDIWFPLGKKDVGISMMGIDDDSRFFKGSLSEDGITVSSALAKKFGYQEGDTVTVKDSNKEKEYDFRIEKIYDYNAAMTIFMPKAELNKILEEDADSFNCILSDKELEIDNMYLAKMISRSDLLGAADQMMDSFDAVIKFVNIFSVVVYMVLMYILTKLVIDKNAISISFMKVFGYEPKEIRKLYLTATTIVVVVSLVVCIPAEAALFKVMLVLISSMIEGYLEFYLPAAVYIEIIVIGIVAYFVINAFHIGSVKKIPMTDALKNRE